MSYGPGASLGGGLQVCALQQLCLYSNPSVPLSPAEGCNNGGPGAGGSSPGGDSCSRPPDSGSSAGGPDMGSANGNGSGDSPQYQLFNAVILPYWPLNRTHPPYVLFGEGDIIGCAPPPGTSPPAVPAGGSRVDFSFVSDTADVSRVSGLSVNCVETGVTQTSACGSSSWYYGTEATHTYNASGGTGTLCEGPHVGQSFSFGSGTGSGTGNFDQVTLHVSR